MPEFSTAFSGLAAERKLTQNELVRAIRFMIAAEFEAIQLYEQLAESTENELARKVLFDIIGEEKEHVGEFRYLLQVLAPGDEAEYSEGYVEARGYLEPLIERFGLHGDGCGKCPTCGAELHGEPHTCTQQEINESKTGVCGSI